MLNHGCIHPKANVEICCHFFFFSLSLFLTFIFSTSTSSLPIFHTHIPFQELGCKWITYYSKVNVKLYQCHIQLIVKYVVHKTENKTIDQSYCICIMYLNFFLLMHFCSDHRVFIINLNLLNMHVFFYYLFPVYYLIYILPVSFSVWLNIDAFQDDFAVL